MNQTAQGTLSGSVRLRFPFPADAQAWWNFCVSAGVGWLLVLGLRWDPLALALALAGASLFFSSEWLSHLAGRSREGDVRPARLLSPLGLGLLGSTALSLGAFLVRVGGQDREAWATAITAVGCLVAFMFVLRMELRPMDSRLLFLTHFIVTLPCLMYGFVNWGVGAPQAFGAWYLPAAYFPAQALFAQYWMEGPDAPASRLSSLAGPLLIGILLLATREQWPAVAFLALFLMRTVWGLQVRRRSAGLPGFGAIRRFSWELQLWTLGGVMAWALSLR
jgi:hypothetical protein